MESKEGRNLIKEKEKVKTGESVERKVDKNR